MPNTAFVHPLAIQTVKEASVTKAPIAKGIPASFYKFDDKIKAVAAKYNVPWYWIKGIALNESLLGEDPRVKSGAVSSDGKSYGIMQFTFPTAKDMAGRDVTIAELNNNDFSFNIGGKFLASLNKIFNGDEKKIIMSYNQGAGNTQKGKTYASSYYDRFLRWKETISKMQGGV